MRDGRIRKKKGESKKGEIDKERYHDIKREREWRNPRKISGTTFVLRSGNTNLEILF